MKSKMYSITRQLYDMKAAKLTNMFILFNYGTRMNSPLLLIIIKRLSYYFVYSDDYEQDHHRDNT